MAKRPNLYASSGLRPGQIDRMDQSRFWQRLDELSRREQSEHRKGAIDQVKASIRKVTEQAKWISTQVCRFMPQYTLHEERHFLNVLAIMDALVPDDIIAQYGPLDCALPILAAYTHDLGMALSDQEHDALFDESTERGKHFASYRSRFDEELHQLHRWRMLTGQVSNMPESDARQAQRRIGAIEGHILASYLRETHTDDDQIRRLRHWLEFIKQETGDDKLFYYDNFNYQRALSLIGISHGRSAPWLRRQLTDGEHDGLFFQSVAKGEAVNLAFVGLLLRLADIMDFDASRAPRILFKHFGIDNDQSILEWNKHLSIVGWRLDVDPDGKQQPDLLYSAQCQHPVHEKAIREFKTWIDAELSAVRVELDTQRRQLPAAVQPRYSLHLPSQTRVDIRPARDPLTDQPKYVYHDLQFHLDQDEILQLLMGESLYGDPGLCIRELLQNALDALELRELRLKMKQKAQTREPVDGMLHPTKKGWVINDGGQEEQLRVRLDWGTDEDTGQQWLRVIDNGVGMTEEVINNYFTQIGKSYYRSPGFNQERAVMEAAGEVISPISTFGVGILSCFMIANRIQVRTRPAQADSIDRQPFDITVSGPGSLFWFQPGSMEQQGTEIKLYLNQRFVIAHNQHTLFTTLENYFGYSSGQPLAGNSNTIDPPLIAAQNAVWPLYPIEVYGPGEKIPIRIDGHFHEKVLAPLNTSALKLKAKEWHVEDAAIDEVKWHVWDWVDDEGETATGSRVRVWVPLPLGATSPEEPVLHDETAGFQIDTELWPFVEPSLDASVERTRILVNGFDVADVEICYAQIPVRNAIGTRVWIDLRGVAAPRLTVSRKRAIPSRDNDDWQSAIGSLVARIPRHLFAGMRLTGLRNEPGLSLGDASARRSCDTFDVSHLIQAKWHDDARLAIELAVMRSLQAQSHSDKWGYTFVTRALLSIAEHERTFFSSTQDEISRLREQIRQLGRNRFDLLIRLRIYLASLFWNEDWLVAEVFRCLSAHTVHEEIPVGDIVVPSKSEFGAKFFQTFAATTNAFLVSFLTECIDQHSDVWTEFEQGELHISDGTLLAPGTVSRKSDASQCSTHIADEHGRVPPELIQRGYDLTFPMTAVPLGNWLRECGAWRSERWYRTLGVAPFLLPALHDLWPVHAESLRATFEVPHIYCLLPRFELWSKRFEDWTDADWRDPENLSALWDLAGEIAGTPGQVLWARGTHDIHAMANIGLPAPEFLAANLTEF